MLLKVLEQEKFNNYELSFEVNIQEEDKLFGSVTAADLVKAFEGNGHEIDKNAIAIPGKTIKRLGSYEAKIRLHREVAIQFSFEVIPEKK